jgi:hypothetical protein
LAGDEFLTGGPGRELVARPDEWLDRDAAAEFEAGTATNAEPATAIPQEMLRTIRDDVIGVHASESDAYYVALRVAEKLTAAERQQAESASYALFMDAPNTCRGRAWKIQGEIRQIESVRSAVNAFGVSSLIDAWVSTPDSGNRLVHVIASSADARLAAAVAAGQKEIPVVVTGVFFKREGYRRAGADQQGDIGLAPLVLGGQLQYFLPEVQVTTRAEELTPWLGWFAVALGLGVVLILWQFQISDRGFRQTRTHQLTMLPVKPGFNSIEAVSVQESLRQMEEDQAKS